MKVASKGMQGTAEKLRGATKGIKGKLKDEKSK
jgi:hypothetical protein